ncbi:MAG: carbohydrate porin [Verrucomicrobiales bacterium]|nr:carbohydrate porin [Verrucomicrobiales bacterium]
MDSILHHVAHRRQIRNAVRCAVGFLALAPILLLSSPPATNAPAVPSSNAVLLLDRHGGILPGATNDPAATPGGPSNGAQRPQIPAPPRGAPQAEAVRQRIADSKSGREWFPSTPPVLPAYLANLDEYGNTALQPGALFNLAPVSSAVQSVKMALSEVGLRYNFYQSVTIASMSGPTSGANALQYYTATYLGKWGVSENPSWGTAAWLSTEFNAQRGLSSNSRSQSLQGNLGSVVNPNATVFGPQGLWISELAWQQSLMNGDLVVLAGQLDQSNYIDSNLYANNSQGQFLNSAFVNSEVLPITYNNLGMNLQYQPGTNGYVMLGIGANAQTAGQSPFTELGFNGVSYLLELGWTPGDVLGLGAGVYRLQPFVATVGGVTQAGVGINLQQRLGKQSPFGWFGRFGVGGTAVTVNGASAEVATGFLLQAPLQWAGLCPGRVNDSLGMGFVWSRPSNAGNNVSNNNEYGIEGVYVLQLTPLVTLEPDLQVLWNPATAPNAQRNIVFQLEFNLTL